MQFVEGFFIWVDRTMFSKVQKKIFAVVVAGLLGLAPCLHASLLMQGQIIPATPYDGRMSTAGVLTIQATLHEAQTMEALFGRAKAFRYQSDAAGDDRWQTPEETESRWAGDCEDKAVWLYAQLKKNGYEGVRLVIGRQNASSRSLHAWVTLNNSDGSFFVLDPTAQKRVWNSNDFLDGSYRPLYSFDGSNRYRHDA